MDLLDIPGYAAALLRERIIREAAFLDITESAGPFELVPMTLRQWMLLRLMQSPLLVKGATPAPAQLAEFLWVLSPEFETKDGPAKAAFLKRCRKEFFPPKYLPLFNTARARRRHELRATRQLIHAARIVDGCRAYVEETMQDRPPSQTSPGFDPDYYSDAAFFCALLASQYGWSQSETLALPLKRLWQYLAVIRETTGSKIPMCNPSDRVRSEWLRSLNQKKERQ